MTSAHPWNDTRILTRMCASLAVNGDDVHLIVPVAEPPPRELQRDVTIHALPLPSNRIGRMTRTCFQVMKKAKQLQADIYHFHDPELIPTALVLQKSGRRVIYDIHEHVADEVANKTYLPAIARRSIAWGVNAISKFGIRRFSGIITAGEDISATVQHLARQLETIHNYPDLRILDKAIQSDQGLPQAISAPPAPYVAFFGGIRPNNVALHIVQALGLIPPDQRPRLLLGGAVHDADRYARIRAMDAWNDTHYVGHVAFEQMLSLSANAICALGLYANEANAQNVRSNRLYESLAMGLPVITPDFPRWQQFIDQHRCGLAVNPDAPEEIARAIQYVLEHPEQARAMGQRGRQLVEQTWNWSHELPKLVNFYDAITKPSGR